MLVGKLLFQYCLGAVQVAFAGAFTNAQQYRYLPVRVIVQLIKAEYQPVLVWQLLYKLQDVSYRYVHFLITNGGIIRQVIFNRLQLYCLFVTVYRFIDSNTLHPSFKRAIIFVLVYTGKDFNKGIVQVVFGLSLITAIFKAQCK